MKFPFLIIIFFPFMISCASKKCCPDQFIWKKGKSTPSEYQGNLVLSEENKIYLLTGAESDNFQSYDVQTKKWSPLPGISVPVSYASGVVLNQVIYIIGGIDSFNNFSQNFQKFDILQNKWTLLPQLENSRRNTASVVYGDKIYLIGGLWSPTDVRTEILYSRKLQEYDLAAGLWLTKSDMPTSRCNVSAVVIDNKILVAGGNTENGATAIVELYDLIRDEWSRAADLPYASESFDLFVMNNSVYAVVRMPGETQTPIIKYDPEADQWTQVDSFRGEGSYFQAVVIGDRVYMLSGEENPVIAWIGRKG
jgi:N-acetylneuraminic acid mutarotase